MPRKAKDNHEPEEPPVLDPLSTALVAARRGLQFALRALIAVRVPDGDALRNAAENALEAVAHDLGNGPPQRATLEEAARQLATVAVRLANDSQADRDTVSAARTHASQAAKFLAEPAQN